MHGSKLKQVCRSLQPNAIGTMLLGVFTAVLLLVVFEVTPITTTTSYNMLGNPNAPDWPLIEPVITVVYPVNESAAALLAALFCYPVFMAMGRREASRTGRHAVQWSRAAFLLSLFPTLLLLVLADIVLYARLRLGRWPAPRDPDPKEIGVDLGTLVFGVFGLFFLLLPVGVVWLVRNRKPVGRLELPSALALALLTWVLFFCVSRYDPGGFLDWLAD